MSHCDKATALPEGFVALGSTDSCVNAAFGSSDKRWYGIQFHAEVSHTEYGAKLIENFVVNVCGCAPSWTMTSFVDAAIAKIQSVVGPDGEVIGAVSGGVDSTVAAVLMTRAIGKRFHAVLVDNGFLRKGEAASVRF
jgi:GMP synthase (glutamine-hydrolysing)